MATYGDMQARIAREIHRSDLTSDIQAAIKSAIDFYSSQRFHWNEKRWTLTTIAGAKYYGTSTPAPGTLPSDIMEIDSITVTANSRIYQLDSRSYTDMDAIDAGTTPLAGYPRLWSWYADQIRLYPTPNQAYVLTISGQYTYPALSASTDESPWTNQAEELIRCRAKRDLYAHVLMDDEQAIRMDGLEARALRSLKAQTNKLVSSGRISATRF
jgi:hypothetical protein